MRGVEALEGVGDDGREAEWGDAGHGVMLGQDGKEQLAEEGEGADIKELGEATLRQARDCRACLLRL